MTWYNFPYGVPDNHSVLVGGFTRPSSYHAGGKWVQVVAYYGKFQEQDFIEECVRCKNDKTSWIVAGFVTLDNFDVDWKYWKYIGSPPGIF